MGQVVKNEQIKLRAAFYNNLGVAVITTGLFIPFLTMMLARDEPFKFFRAIAEEGISNQSSNEVYNGVVGIMAVVVCLFAGVGLRGLADHLLEKIVD